VTDDDYIRSMRITQSLNDPALLVDAAARRLSEAGDGVIRIRTGAGCLVCR